MGWSCRAGRWARSSQGPCWLWGLHATCLILKENDKRENVGRWNSGTVEGCQIVRRETCWRARIRNLNLSYPYSLFFKNLSSKIMIPWSWRFSHLFLILPHSSSSISQSSTFFLLKSTLPTSSIATDEWDLPKPYPFWFYPLRFLNQEIRCYYYE